MRLCYSFPRNSAGEITITLKPQGKGFSQILLGGSIGPVGRAGVERYVGFGDQRFPSMKLRLQEFAASLGYWTFLGEFGNLGEDKATGIVKLEPGVEKTAHSSLWSA